MKTFHVTTVEQQYTVWEINAPDAGTARRVVQGIEDGECQVFDIYANDADQIIEITELDPDDLESEEEDGG